jgi:DNA polymerase I-like protein with 3'-5' exonuclease and polymerase domains
LLNPVMIAVDLAQIDARMVAVHSQDPGYIAMFAPGKDLHTWVAERLWHDASRRQDAKVLAHGWAYNMGIKSLARHTKLPIEEAVEYDKFLRKSFPLLVKWKDAMVKRAESGALLDNGWGRKMRPNPERAWTQGPALMGQGGARDAMMEGILRVATKIPESLGWFRGQIHDELVMSVPERDAEEIEHEVAKAMSYEWCPPHGSIPIQVIAEPGKARGKRWSSVYG